MFTAAVSNGSAMAIGDNLELVMGDGQGNVTGMFASGFDISTDQTVSWPSQLYFSGYALTGIGNGQFAWDKIFTLEHLHARAPIVGLPHRHGNWVPSRWMTEHSAAHERERSKRQDFDRVTSGPLAW